MFVCSSDAHWVGGRSFQTQGAETAKLRGPLLYVID